MITHDQRTQDAYYPIQSDADLRAPKVWPIQTVIASATSQDVGLHTVIVADYGGVQVAVGLQREQLREFGEHLLKLDKTLPPSRKFIIGDNIVVGEAH